MSGDGLAMNSLRFGGRPGHVESYFLRANDPERPRAVWVKATVYAPLRGEPQVESWFVYFDQERPEPVAGRETSTFTAGLFTEGEGRLRVKAGRLSLDFGSVGSAIGVVQTGRGDARIDLRWAAPNTLVAAPLSMLRPQALIDGPFPRSKLLTPFPSLTFTGAIDVGGERIDLRNWRGMQGHNWGREHAIEYAWGQCLFAATSGEPEAMVEAFTARVLVGPLQTPRISCLVIRRGGETLRFDRLFDLFQQEATLCTDRWFLNMRGSDGEARLFIDGTGRTAACLGYRNPDGELRHCFNTKLARVRLQVQPRRGPAFVCESDHGGALEFLRRAPDPRFPNVI